MGQTTPGGIFELFYPKWRWVNGVAPADLTYRTIFTEIILKHPELDGGCYRLVFTKIKFAYFEL